jgi:hypothetical protein
VKLATEACEGQAGSVGSGLDMTTVVVAQPDVVAAGSPDAMRLASAISA